MTFKYLTWSAVLGLFMTLTACGGGSSDNAGATNTGTGADSVSSGAITAFGSVFVNGNEFSTTHAKVIDDDTGAISTSTAGLEVGMVVDVKFLRDGSTNHSTASELHVHPLVRGYVDASDTTAGTLTVMGQTIAISSATTFSDHRACISAASNSCAAITDQTGLTAGTSTPTYVTVHGYLFNANSAGGTTNIVATLVSVFDAPTGTSDGASFKAEGVVTATGSSSVTIGALNVDLTTANCYVSGAKASCATAFSTGQVVSAFSPTAPSLPATTFTAAGARLSARIPVEAAGTSVEVEGAVSSVTISPAAFVMRGVNIDASALSAGTGLPAVGDIVKVIGTVASDGLSITATAVTVLHVANSASYGFEGALSNVAAGSAADTYTITLLGQSINVTSSTRLADRSTKTWEKVDPAANPFNINTFQAYLAASTSQQVIVYTGADASGNLTAEALTIVPASSVSGVAGIVDATPAPVNSSATGTPATFAVHGLSISADPAAIYWTHGGSTIASGDQVLVLGSFAAGTLTVSATPSSTNEVIDFGVPKRRDLNCF